MLEPAIKQINASPEEAGFTIRMKVEKESRAIKWVRMILEKKKLKQREIATLLGIDQAEVSKLMNGQYHLFAEGRLFGFLNQLNKKVTVRITPRRRGESPQEVVLG